MSSTVKRRWIDLYGQPDNLPFILPIPLSPNPKAFGYFCHRTGN
jgi:hypothetical protein